jgi:hypothetical protein
LQEDEKPVLAYGNEKIAEKDATQSEEDVRGGGQSSVPSPILEV